MKQVLVLDDYQDIALSVAPWEKLSPRAHVSNLTRHIVDRDELVDALADVQVIVVNRERTPMTRELIMAAPSLELIVTLGMGNASIDIAAAAAQGVVVCGTPMLGYPTAELTWALITALMRNIVEESNSLRAGKWQAHPVGVELRDKTLGIAGFGRIGRDVARIGIAFGMNVLAWSRSLTPEAAVEAGVTCVAEDELWRASDVLSIHLPLTPQTRDRVNSEAIAAMKPMARLINTSRSAIVNKQALIAALESGKLAGAALDVYDDEPLPAGDPIRSTPNTLLTPHLGYVTEDNYRLAFGHVVDDIVAWLDGVPLRVIQPPAPA